MASGNYYGFYDYWNLYHKVTFDGVNKIIYINDGETSVDVQIDLYSSWKEWLRLEDYAKYLQCFSVVGGEPTVEGQQLDATYFLINGWRIKPYPGSYNLVFTGNIFEVDGGNIAVPADKFENVDNNITINTNTSVIVRRVTSDSGTSGAVSASLFGDQETALYDISGSVVSIESSVSTLVQTNATQSNQLTSLIDTNASQSAQIAFLQDKLIEIWELHGLDNTKPLTVTQTARTFGSVSQSINTTGTGSLQQTIITRTV